MSQELQPSRRIGKNFKVGYINNSGINPEGFSSVAVEYNDLRMKSSTDSEYISSRKIFKALDYIASSLGQYSPQKYDFDGSTYGYTVKVNNVKLDLLVEDDENNYIVVEAEGDSPEVLKTALERVEHALKELV